MVASPALPLASRRGRARGSSLLSMFDSMVAPSSKGTGGVNHGHANAGIGATAADVAVHSRIDLGGGRLLAAGERLEEGGRAHDLTALAVAALRHVVLDPCFVHGGSDAVGAIGRCFDRGDLLACGVGGGRDTGADSLAVEMHGAGAAQRSAAAELGAGHPQRVAQGPKDGSVG